MASVKKDNKSGNVDSFPSFPFLFSFYIYVVQQMVRRTKWMVLDHNKYKEK